MSISSNIIKLKITKEITKLKKDGIPEILPFP